MLDTLKKYLVLMTLGTVLAACSQTTRTGETEGYCSVFPNITYSSRDTPETVSQIVKHNAGRDRLCK